MQKDEIVKIMCDVVNQMNFEIAQSQGADMNEAMMAIEQHQPHLIHVNTMILNELVNKGLVNVSNLTVVH